MSTLRTNTLQTVDSAFTVNVSDIISGITNATPISSIAALRAMTVPRTVQLVDYYGDWDVRTQPQALGGGFFDWDPDSVLADNNGTIIKLAAFATGRMIRRTFNLPVIPQWFGAIGDNVHDDFAALQASIDWAQDNGGLWYLPASKTQYFSSQGLVQTKRLTACGAGQYASRIRTSTSTNAWLATPPINTSNNDWQWRDFGIDHTTPGGGTYGLHIQLTDIVGPDICFLADSKVTNMFLGNFGAEGLFLDNGGANVDGFFTSQFTGNSIVNGVRGAFVGDSLRFAHNKIYGKNCFIMEGVAGARQMTIEDNNITTHGGLIALLNVEEALIKDNQLEHPGYLSGYTGALGAGVLLFNCYKPEIVSNTINPDNGAATAPNNPGLVASAIAFTGTTTNAILDNNDIAKGSVDHISITGAVNKTFIGEFNTYYGASPVVSDGGIATKRILYGSTTWNPPNLVNGAAATTTVTVTGARFGNFTNAAFAQNLLGLIMTSWVSSNDTVTVQLINFTGAPIDLVNVALNVRVTS